MEDNESNQNETEHFLASGFVPLVDTFPIVLAVFIVATNGLALFLFVTKHRLRNITNTLLVSLAISDLTTGLFGIPFYLVCSATQHKLCMTATLCWRFTTTSTVLHLLAVTIDRYVAIVHAIRYHTIVTRSRSNAAIFIMWSLSAFVSLIQLAWRLDQDELERLSEEEREEMIMQYYSVTGVYQVVILV